MKTTDTGVTVGQLVAERPSRARVFERLGIDYCCGGKLTLEQACSKKGLDAASLLEVLHASEADGRQADSTDWTRASLAELCDHIESTHHEYLKRELPRIAQMTVKVAAVHSDEHPELDEVRYTFALLKAELDEHLPKEERILFPIVRQLEAGSLDAGSHCGGIDRPIAVMEHEHDSAGHALAKLRQLTSNYTVPADGCNTYRAMMSALIELEADLHQHIHKENNILFPRALEIARQVCHTA